MGFFSFRTIEDNGRIIIGERKKVYLLVPKEYVEVYGDYHLCNEIYDGYGHWNGGNSGLSDLYLILLDWMVRSGLSAEKIFEDQPKKESYRGVYGYYAAMSKHYKNMANYTMLLAKPDSVYVSEEARRSLGIDIYFSAKAEKRPLACLRFTFNPEARYEDFDGESKDDPMQGCF